MQIFHVVTECSSVISDGGVGDVVLQIAKQCASEDHQTTIILPYYGKLDDKFQKQFGRQLEDSQITAPSKHIFLAFPRKDNPSEPYELVRFASIDYPVGKQSLRLCFIDSLRFRRRQKPYGRPEAYPDVYPINILLQKAALHYIADVTKKSIKETIVIHGHDAHAGMLPLLARTTNYLGQELADCTFITTAHNCGWGYRQRLWMSDFDREMSFLTNALQADSHYISECIINDGPNKVPGFEPFAAAVLFGDYLTIVSEGYRWEIIQSGKLGTSEFRDEEVSSFAAFLEERRKLENKQAMRAEIVGITNGTDPEEVGSEALPSEVRPQDLLEVDFTWKPQFKKDFLDRVRMINRRPAYWSQIEHTTGNLDQFSHNGCLFTYVGRLDQQKGLDILAQAVQEVFAFDHNAGLCLLGGGELPELRRLAEIFPGRVIIFNGRSENVAKEIYAAGDFFLLPSRFEPCGLTDFRAQLNGNIPIANQVGGLAKIINGKTGIGFFGLGDRSILRGLVDGMLQAIDLFQSPARLSDIQITANRYIRENYTWAKVFPQYRRLYESGPRNPFN